MEDGFLFRKGRLKGSKIKKEEQETVQIRKLGEQDWMLIQDIKHEK